MSPCVRTFQSAFVEFEDVIIQGRTIADIHIVQATKKDRSVLRFKVMAFYTIDNGKIMNVRELTHM
jgi:hypothetical protein